MIGNYYKWEYINQRSNNKDGDTNYNSSKGLQPWVKTIELPDFTALSCFMNLDWFVFMTEKNKQNFKSINYKVVMVYWYACLYY